jgi:hypothetical protein
MPCPHPPGDHGSPPLSVTHLPRCRIAPPVRHPLRRPTRKGGDHRVPQGGMHPHSDPPDPPQHGREQRCGAPRALQRLARHRRCRLGDICMGTHAAMGRTTASGRPHRRCTTSMTTSWPVDRRVHHTVSAATPTTPALKNPTTMTTRPPR